MTTAVQPVPVDGKTKEGPNKVLIGVLGVVAAVALFMFVIKPLLLDSKEAPKSAPATTSAQSGASTGTAGGATTEGKLPGKTTTGTASGNAGAATAPATGDGGDSAPAPATVNPQADSLPQIPAQYAGQPARDPFVPLAQTSGTSSGTSTSKSK